MKCNLVVREISRDVTTPSGALVAMSGGVDSSVAAFLAIARGLDCIGGMMKLSHNEDTADSCEKRRALADAEDARVVAGRLGIPFYVFNFADVFDEQVIRRFVEIYQNGATPNPCIDCNRRLKFGRLLQCAMELGREYIVTGHYAKIDYDAGGNRYILKKATDAYKDQSYVLYALTQEQLKHTHFPLGGISKSQVRNIAAEQGFINAKKHDSQDICFVRNGSYSDFIRQYTGQESPKGRFVDVNGKDLGMHKGIIHYTVGQRRGLGLSAEAPLYVCSICAKNNTVTVGVAEHLFAKTLIARDINLIPTDRFDAPVKIYAKTRYKQPEQPATVWQTDDDTLRIEFDRPQRAMTKGQAVVLYDSDVVIGGGTISEII